MRKHGVVCTAATRSALTHRRPEASTCARWQPSVATIPRRACLTPLTSGAAAAIEAAELGVTLALAVAVMYERSRGAESPWNAYFRLVPECEPVPLVWPADEAERFLAGTELDKIVKQDRQFLSEDWKECIEPLITSAELEVDPDDFSLEKYFAPKSLLSSRSFYIDSYHGSGMVPLSDLFNHKTDGEHVHFTKVSDAPKSDNDDDDEEEKEEDQEEDENDASASEQPTVQNCDTNPSGYNDEDMEMIIVREANAGEDVMRSYQLPS